jgi:CRISPR-associated protein Cas2
LSRRRYLVSYDIRDDHRLRTVQRIMKQFGWRMQYSLFICDLDQIELLRLRAEIGSIINHALDSVAIVDLGAPTERGRSCFEFMGAAPRIPTSGPLIL